MNALTVRPEWWTQEYRNASEILYESTNDVNIMRILHLFHRYLPITENWAFRMIDSLPQCENVIGSERFLKTNFYPQHMHYIEFPLKPIEPLMSTALLKGLRRGLNRLIKWSLTLYPLYLEHACRRYHVDIMHSHYAFVGWQYRKLSKVLRVPHVVSFYGVDYEWFPHTYPVWKTRYQQLFQQADLFLCEGRHGASLIERIGCPQAKIRVARLGVNVNEIPVWERSKHPEELHLLQIAAFREKKGQRYTIEAFLRSAQDCPNMTLTLVGGDPHGIKAELQHIVADNPFRDKIIFLEGIDFARLHRFMKDYHVFIHPSCYSAQRDCEGGAPIVLLDAQATGMPVLATTHCDIPDEVIHGETGLLSPEKDSAALAESIRAMYHVNQEEYDCFANHARRHVEQHYDVIQNARQVQQEYAALLANQKGF